MAEMRNLSKLVNQLRTRAASARKDWGLSVAVGYTAGYALRVHEDLTAFHRNGQAKFLEQPFRELAKDLWAIIVNAIKAGKTPAQALLLAGLRLQRESQKLVPVKTGNLKNSAYTRLEGR